VITWSREKIPKFTCKGGAREKEIASTSTHLCKDPARGHVKKGLIAEGASA
jgi:hypothetical protein